MIERRRVAVTGIGVVSPCGIGKDDFWNGLLRAQPEGERRVHDFDATLYYEESKDIRRADRFEQFAIACAHEALAQSGRPGGAPERIGVAIGTGIGGAQVHEDQTLLIADKGPRRISPFTVPMMMANAAAAAVSIAHGFQGPCECITTACAAGTHSIGQAAHWIQWGICDAAIAGGSEAAMTPVALSAFARMKALSPSGRSRPFDAGRDGFVIAEGAALLVLEEWEAARARGATILGEIMGSASLADAHHITAPAPGGAGASLCMRTALLEAGLSPADIGHVNAHGTSTPLNDAAEAQAIAEVFGPPSPGQPGPIVTSTKGVLGHALGAAGALEAAAVLLSQQRGLIPPTDGLEDIDADLPPIDLVRKDARPWTPAPALSNSFGFGGHNGTLVIGPA